MKIRPFELVLMTIFAILGLVALAMLSLYKPSTVTKEAALGNSVIIWGTVPSAAFQAVLRPLIESNPAYHIVQYVEKDARTFDNELLNALAESRGPDIIFMPSEKLVQYRSKIQALPENTFPLRDFRNLYIDGAEIFALSDGVYAYPVAIDPLVMYFNRDLLGQKNIIYPPKTWPELMGEVKQLSITDYSRSISQSAVALGEYTNVTHAYDILSLLLLQGGSSMVVEKGDQYKVLLNQNLSGAPGLPLAVTLNWYDFFSNPTNEYYSWNLALPSDLSAFVSEKLVFYFGKGSEGANIENQNPNLNFDVTGVPQGGTDKTERTYASFYGLALMRSSTNQTGSLMIMQLLGAADKSKVIADTLHMAPAHRTTLNAGSNDKYGRISYDAAKVSRGWLSPNPDATGRIFKSAIETVGSNSRNPTDAATDVVKGLSEVYQ